MSRELITTFGEIAHGAGRIAIEARREGLRQWTKNGNELVTSAELRVHEQVTSELARALPGIPLVTEESTEHTIPDGAFIVVDEIDGTAPFAAGADSWGVMLALVEYEPVAGVIHLPDRQVTIAAQRREGCWIDGERVTRRYEGGLRDAVAGADVSAGLDDAGWRMIHDITLHARALRSFACAAAGAQELLQGVTQLYVNPVGGKIWDFAPFAIALTEAGGTTTTVGGAPLRWDAIHMSFLACASRALADEVLALR